jgi:hypothetical protein
MAETLNATDDPYVRILDYLDELTAVDMECRASGISANVISLSKFLTMLQQFPAEEQITLLQNKIAAYRTIVLRCIV